MGTLNPCLSGKSVVKSHFFQRTSAKTTAIWCDLVQKTTPPPAKRDKDPLMNQWLTAQSECDGSRRARRPVQERAAPTAFQRTSLHTKCNILRRDCKNSFCRSEQIIGKTLARGQNILLRAARYGGQAQNDAERIEYQMLTKRISIPKGLDRSAQRLARF
jgi:hypothetical protein